MSRDSIGGSFRFLWNYMFPFDANHWAVILTTILVTSGIIIGTKWASKLLISRLQLPPRSPTYRGLELFLYPSIVAESLHELSIHSSHLQPNILDIIATSYIGLVIHHGIRFLLINVGNKVQNRQSILQYLSYIIALLVILKISNLLDPAEYFLRSKSMSIGNKRIELLEVITMVLTLCAFYVGFLATWNTIEKKIHTLEHFDSNLRIAAIRIGHIALITLFSILALTTIGLDLTILTVFTGAMGLGLGLGMQKLFANYLSGLFLLFERSICIGDCITIKGKSGVVVDMKMRYTHLKTLDSQDIFVPNESFINEVTSSEKAQKNFRQDLNKRTIQLSFPQNTDMTKVIDILKTSMQESIHIQNDSPPCVLLSQQTVDITFQVKNLEGHAGTVADIKNIICQKLADNSISLCHTPPH